jgi:hypothetical protein
MKKFFALALTAAAAQCLAVLPANAQSAGAADSRLGSPVTTPSLVPMAATAINGLIQAESIQQKMAEDREAAEKRLAADKAAAEQRANPQEPIETVAVVSDVAAPESIELPEIETPD